MMIKSKIKSMKILLISGIYREKQKDEEKNEADDDFAKGSANLQEQMALQALMQAANQ